MQGASRPSRAASVEAVAPGAPAFSDTFTSQPEPDGDDDPLADERYAVVSLLSQRKALDAEFAEEVREVTKAAGSATLSTRTADERVRQRTLHKLHPRLASIAQRDTSLDEAITLRTEAQVRKLQAHGTELAMVLQTQHEANASAREELAQLTAELAALQAEEAAAESAAAQEPGRLAAQEAELGKALKAKIRQAATAAVADFEASTAAVQSSVTQERYQEQLAAQRAADDEVDGHLAYLHRHSLTVGRDLAGQAAAAYLAVHRKELVHWLRERSKAKEELQLAQTDFAALVHDVAALVEHEDNASLVVEKGSFVEDDSDLGRLSDVESDDESISSSRAGLASTATWSVTTKASRKSRKSLAAKSQVGSKSHSGRSRTSRRIRAGETMFGGRKRAAEGVRTVRTSSRGATILDGFGEIKGGQGPNLLTAVRGEDGEEDGIRGGISDEESTDSEDEGVDERRTTHDKLTAEPLLLHKDRVNAFFEDPARALGPDVPSAHYTGEAEEELRSRVLDLLRRDITRADLRTHTLPSARVGTVTAHLDTAEPDLHGDTLHLPDGSFSSPLGHVLAKQEGRPPKSPRRTSMAVMARTGSSSSLRKSPPRSPKAAPRPPAPALKKRSPKPSAAAPAAATSPSPATSPKRRVTMSRSLSQSRIIVPDAPVFESSPAPSPTRKGASPRRSILKRSSSGGSMTELDLGSPATSPTRGKRAGFSLLATTAEEVSDDDEEVAPAASPDFTPMRVAPSLKPPPLPLAQRDASSPQRSPTRRGSVMSSHFPPHAPAWVGAPSPTHASQPTPHGQASPAQPGDAVLGESAGELVFSQDAPAAEQASQQLPLGADDRLLPADLNVDFTPEQMAQGRAVLSELQKAVVADCQASLTYKPREMLSMLQSMQRMAVQTAIMCGDSAGLQRLKEAYDAELGRLGDVAAIVALEDYHAHLRKALVEADLAAGQALEAMEGGQSAGSGVLQRMGQDGQALQDVLDRRQELAASAAAVRNDALLRHEAFQETYGEEVPVSSDLLPHMATMR